MEISIFLKDRKVTPGRSLPVSAICKGKEYLPKGKKWFPWIQGHPADDVEGEDVLVTGVSYSIGKRRYDLSSGYAVVAKLTPKCVLVPHLRKAQGREVTVKKTQEGLANNTFWPVIVRTWTDKPEPEEYIVEPNHEATTKFITEAMLQLSETTGLIDDLNLEDRYFHNSNEDGEYY
jgi:hypothetical protein